MCESAELQVVVYSLCGSREFQVTVYSLCGSGTAELQNFKSQTILCAEVELRNFKSKFWCGSGTAELQVVVYFLCGSGTSKPQNIPFAELRNFRPSSHTLFCVRKPNCGTSSQSSAKVI